MQRLKNIKNNLVLLTASLLLYGCGTTPQIVSSSIEANADLMAPEQDQSYLTEMDEAVCQSLGCTTSPEDVKKPDKKQSGFKTLFGQ